MAAPRGLLPMQAGPWVRGPVALARELSLPRPLTPTTSTSMVWAWQLAEALAEWVHARSPPGLGFGKRGPASSAHVLAQRIAAAAYPLGLPGLPDVADSRPSSTGWGRSASGLSMDESDQWSPNRAPPPWCFPFQRYFVPEKHQQGEMAGWEEVFFLSVMAMPVLWR